MDVAAPIRISLLSRAMKGSFQHIPRSPCSSKTLQRTQQLQKRHHSVSRHARSPFFRHEMPRIHQRTVPAFPHSAIRRSSSSTAPDNAPKEASQGQAATADSPKNVFPNLRQKAPQDVAAPEPNERGEVPAYDLTFTCKPCKTRSTHRVSKHGYHNGTVLITCPECKNRHVISDHLKIFNDNKKSFEQILKEKGELLKTGVLDPDRDIELWDDGSQTLRNESASSSEKPSK